MIILLYFLLTSQKLIHCIKPVGICIIITKFDVDYDVSLLLP